MKLLLHASLAVSLFLLAGAADADSPMSPARPLPRPAGASAPGRDSASSQAKPPVDVTSGTEIKPGRWQFTSELAAASQPNGGAQATYQSCIDRANALPVEFGPECQLQHVEGHGAQIVWAMNCPGRHLRIDGVAHYHGDTMDATVVSHLPASANAAAGAAVTQHISGHFLSACPREAQQRPASPPAPIGATAPAKEVPVAEASIEPPSASPTAPAASAKIANAEVPNAETSIGKAPQGRRTARVSHHYRRHYAGWSYAGVYYGQTYNDRGRDY